MLPVWPQYFDSADSVVYVLNVGMAELLAEAVIELLNVLEHPKLQVSMADQDFHAATCLAFCCACDTHKCDVLCQLSITRCTTEETETVMSEDASVRSQPYADAAQVHTPRKASQ